MKKIGTYNNPCTLSQYKEIIQKKEQENRFWRPLARKLDQIMINRVKLQENILKAYTEGDRNIEDYRKQLTGKLVKPDSEYIQCDKCGMWAESNNPLSNVIRTGECCNNTV